jgi:hypothetical protein
MTEKLLADRRAFIIGIAGLVLSGPEAAFACHEKDHHPWPCNAAVAMPVDSNKRGPQAKAAAQVMPKLLKLGHIGIDVVDTGASVDHAIEAIRNILLADEKPASVFVLDQSLPIDVIEQLAQTESIPFLSSLAVTRGNGSVQVFRLGADASDVSRALPPTLDALKVGRGPLNFVFDARWPDYAEKAIAALLAQGWMLTRIAVPPESLDAIKGLIGQAGKSQAWILSLEHEAIAPAVAAIRASDEDSHIVAEAPLGDAELILKPINDPKLVLLTSFSSLRTGNVALLIELDKMVGAGTGLPLTAMAALAATGAQVMTLALANAEGKDVGQAMYESIAKIDIEDDQLLMAWPFLRFDAKAGAFEGMQVVPLIWNGDSLIEIHT